MCSLEASRALVANVFLKKLEKLCGLKKFSRTLSKTGATVERLILYLYQVTKKLVLFYIEKSVL